MKTIELEKRDYDILFSKKEKVGFIGISKTNSAKSKIIETLNIIRRENGTCYYYTTIKDIKPYVDTEKENCKIKIKGTNKKGV